jgi:hypothetical protein
LATDERGEHFGDGGVIVRRVIGDAMQRVDAAEPYIQFSMAELVDGTDEPFGDLALLGDQELFAADWSCRKVK